jgi:mono/diheme cytochrome c family protein
MVPRIAFGGLVVLVACTMWAVARAGEEDGQAVYQAKCRQCHGEEGRGAQGPSLVPFEWSYQQALELIRQPVCDMPPIPASEVSDAEVAQLVEYLKRLK